MDTRAALERYFGYTEFRPGQEALIDALLAGRDIFGIMPTGSGKSVCYQLPALLTPGVTLVVSPLIALMNDQVMSLRRRGIPGAYINGSLTPAQCNEALRRAASGAYKIIYVAPERLHTPRFIELMRQIRISLLIVDEAHCISQWGREFRPDYLRIADFTDLLPERPVLGAFTATATGRVRQDILDALRLNDPYTLTTGFDRPNLFFDVKRPGDKYAELESYLSERGTWSCIVYCNSRPNVTDVCARLIGDGFRATYYHGGLDGETRDRNQRMFLSGEARIMVSTNAFGMGIDKPDVRAVIHYNMPRDIESYYQEAGRAGRDGKPSECIAYYSHGDYLSGLWQIEHAGDGRDTPVAQRKFNIERDTERLNQMRDYCRLRSCYRTALLDYFGDAAPRRCDNCGNCRGIRGVAASVTNVLKPR